jgi:hypothetical protein
MNAHELSSLFLHWFWVAFFITFGAYLIMRRRSLSPVSAAVGAFGTCKIRARDASTQQRLDAAAARRENSEHIPSYVGLYMGAAAVLMGVIAAFTWIQPALLYGVLCSDLAIIMAAAYLHLRNSQPRRIAMLSVRTPDSVIPSYWFILSAIAALALLTYATQSQFAISSAVVCVTTLVTTAIAWRLTQLPAMLAGVDVPAEQVVDDRLRFSRSASALILAMVQPFVFCSQTIVVHTSIAQTATLAFASVIWIAFCAWVIAKQFRPLTIANA